MIAFKMNVTQARKPELMQVPAGSQVVAAAVAEAKTVRAAGTAAAQPAPG